MINTLAEIGYSVMGTALTSLIVIPYIMGWAWCKSLIPAKASKPTMDEALNNLDSSYAIKTGVAYDA
jgi:hypothetical protein